MTTDRFHLPDTDQQVVTVTPDGLAAAQEQAAVQTTTADASAVAKRYQSGVALTAGSVTFVGVYAAFTTTVPGLFGVLAALVFAVGVACIASALTAPASRAAWRDA